MIKLYLKSIIIAILSIICITASAYDCKVDGFYYNLNEADKTASVTTFRIQNMIYDSNDKRFFELQGSITIPSTFTYNGTTYNVTSIESESFHNYRGLTSITIPNSVTSIGYSAFSDCSSLESIVVASDNKVYDSRNNCNAIIETASNALIAGCKNTIIPNSVTSIGGGAFQGCSGLTSIQIPSGVTSIGAWAFADCSGLTSITIPNKVTSIGSYAFYGCSGLISIDIPNSVTNISSDAFRGCSGLTSVSIPNSVTKIVVSMFYGCTSLTSITIPNSVTEIESWAFKNCTGLTSITIPSSVTSIGEGAFGGCKGLTSITIPNTVTSIGSSAFRDCSGLTSITIPNSVTSIRNTSFRGCCSLESIVVASGNPVYDSRNNCNAIIETSTNTLITGCKKTVIPNTVTCIGDDSFAGSENAPSDYGDSFSITIPNSVTSIGFAAFMNCGGLSSISIPNSVTSIGNYAFAGCTGLTSLVIPNSVTSIGYAVFSNCSGLKFVTIPNSVTKIGSYAFERCNCCVICNREAPPTANDNSFNESMIAFVPSGSVSLYQQATGWKKMSIQSSPCYLAETTQSTITLCSYDFISNFKADLNGVSYYSKNDSIKITGLEPNTEYTISLTGDIEDLHLEYQMNVTTKNVNLGIELVKRTNLTLRLKGYNVGDAVFSSTGFEGYEGQNEIYIKDLVPGRTYYYTYYVVTPSGKKFSMTNSFQTLPITLNVSVDTGPSSASLSGSSNIIDATITEYGFDGYPKQNPIKITGLDPNKSYSQTFYIVTKEGGRISKSVTYTTKSLTLTTSQPKVISAGNVIVAAESNLDDEETNVGFEWRRIDYTDDFASLKGNAYLYNGTMEGYIRNLYTEKLWKYRPYYTSNAGNSYYGEWVGIDPTNTSYFEPTVHTYANVSVNGNSAEVKGYVQRGTDNVVSKGFAYWKQPQGVKAREAMAAPSKISSLPSNAKTIEVSGSQQVMTASLSNLEYETTYCYVAFVRTSEGDTFYGEEITFTSGESPYTLGDVNGDKEIDISDVVAMVNHILGSTSSTSFKPQAADINKDSNIDISDVVSLVNIILAQ